MSLLQSIIDRFLGRTNPTPQVVLAVSDDGSADPVDAGKLSPLRADPTTGELLVKSSGGGGGGGGAVTQSTGNTSTPWYMQGVNGGSAERLATFAKQPALGTAGTASTDVITVQGIAGATPLPSSNAASSQADGHSATIGTTTDADTTNTVIGRLKKIVSLLAGGLPAALGANGGLKIEGVVSGTTVPVDTELPTAAALSDTIAGNLSTPTVGAALLVFDRNSTTQYQRLAGNGTTGVYVQGASADGAATSERPVLAAFSDGTNKKVPRVGAATVTNSLSTVPATITSTSAGAVTPSAAKLVKASAGRLRTARAVLTSAGPVYVQIHDVASTGSLSSSTMIEGLVAKLANADDAIDFDFSMSPHSFTSGCVIALSSTRNTFTTSGTAQFYAQWE